MTKELSLILFALILLNSCKDKKTENLQTMKKQFEASLNDKAFSDNAQIKILELNAISYDTLDENYIDTLKILDAYSKYDHFKKLTDITIERAQLEGQKMRLNSLIGSQTLTDISREDLNKYIQQANSYKDSMIYYLQVDSIIKARISNRKTPENIYQAKIFLKATYSKEGKSENILDTMKVHYDKDFRIIRFDK